MTLPLEQQARLLVLLALTASFPAHAVGILTTDGMGCPSISDHQRFLDEIEKGNFAYRYPAYCVELPLGTRVSEPLEHRRDRYGDQTAEFVWVEVAAEGRYWTLASWIEVRPSGSSDALGAHPTTLKASGVWFANELRSRFQGTVPIHGSDYAFDRIACLPRDITTFHVTAEMSESALVVAGSLRVSSLPVPFEAIKNAQGARYMLHLEAYLFSPAGKLVWEQHGFPQGDAWVNSDGDSVNFRLIGSFAGGVDGHELLILAAGDPILSEVSESRVILGAKKVRLP